MQTRPSRLEHGPSKARRCSAGSRPVAHDRSSLTPSQRSIVGFTCETCCVPQHNCCSGLPKVMSQKPTTPCCCTWMLPFFSFLVQLNSKMESTTLVKYDHPVLEVSRCPRSSSRLPLQNLSKPGTTHQTFPTEFCYDGVLVLMGSG